MSNRLSSLTVACALLLTAAAVSAQDSPTRRPNRAVFANPDADMTQQVAVSASVGSGYDTNAVANMVNSDIQTAAPGISAGSLYDLVSGSVAYTKNGRVGIAASLSSTGRYYQDFSQHPFMPSYAGSAATSWAITGKTKLTASEAATYQPWYTLLPFVQTEEAALGQLSAPNADFGAGGTKYVSTITNAALTQTLTKSTSIAVTYMRQATNYSGFTTNFDNQSGSVAITRSLTRHLGLRLGYGYTDARYADGLEYRGNNIDSGIDYQRDLSLTRRTRLSFSTGAYGVSQQNFSRYDAKGTATLTREIGRTWKAAVVYSRNASYLETLRAPYFYDGVSATFGGLINRRLEMHSAAGVTVGDVGITAPAPSGNSLKAWNATSGVNIAMTRHLAISVDYVFYHYAYDAAALFLPGVTASQRLDRHSVRASLNLWAPIFERRRRADASR